MVAGWAGAFLCCAGIWAGEALIHRADVRESHSRRLADDHPLFPGQDDSLGFAKAQMQTARHIALLFGGGVWFVAAVTIFFARPWRRQLAQVCLAGAILAAVAWSVNPTLAWRRPGLLAPLPIGIASAALASLVALLIPVRPAEKKPFACAGCRYDLTGNESGICPECGRATPQKRADRWQGHAEQLRALSDNNLSVTAP
jgi:hypothetical protein